MDELNIGSKERGQDGDSASSCIREENGKEGNCKKMARSTRELE
jgi:hypothetical protein